MYYTVKNAAVIQKDPLDMEEYCGLIYECECEWVKCMWVRQKCPYGREQRNMICQWRRWPPKPTRGNDRSLGV